MIKKNLSHETIEKCVTSKANSLYIMTLHISKD